MNREKHSWMYDLLFLLVFALAGYLRLTGVGWGLGEHQHPDENTFSSVLYFMNAHKCVNPKLPVEVCPPSQQRWMNVADYFNSKKSTLNPYNIGFGSFVYGDLPMIASRIVMDLTGETNARIFGRQASALADLIAIFLLYLAVSNLYNRRVALLASLFSALAVMQIQQSHFFTIDLFVNAFEMLAIYFAVKILDATYSTDDGQDISVETRQAAVLEDESSQVAGDEVPGPDYQINMGQYARQIIKSPLFLFSVGFGAVYAMALASKLNIFPLALLLPGAFAVRY